MMTKSIPLSGIYIIINNVNKNSYVGSSINISKRWGDHRFKLNRGIHSNKYLQNSWAKYGKDNFIFLLIEPCGKENLIKREQYYIDTLNPVYNVKKIANSSLGVKCSDETKAKLSLASRGRIVSVETRMKLSLANKGKKLSDEHKEKLSVSHKGHKLSDKAKAKLSAFFKGRVGYKHTDEARVNMSNSHKGKTLSTEHKEKLSAIRKGRKISDETKAKMSVARYLVLSDEIRLKLSESGKKAWVKRKIKQLEREV